METELFIQGIIRGDSKLQEFLKAEIASRSYTRISVCAAYATRNGVTLIRSLIAANRGSRFRWIIGLDDNGTEPTAIEIAFKTQGALTRVAYLRPKSLFHPKVYLLDSNNDNTASLIIGSCNLTGAALLTNCETYCVCRAQTLLESELFENYWLSLWNASKPVNDSVIAKYSLEYRQNRRRNPFQPEDAIGKTRQKHVSRAIVQSIGNSCCAWIVLGKNTGGGNQLDVVRNLAPFLGLPELPRKGITCYLTLSSETGMRRYQLTFTKGMWRFMNLQQGFSQPLRPNPSMPSPYILLLKRTASSKPLHISIKRRDAISSRRLISKSREIGFSGRSLAGNHGRDYGWL